MLSFKWFFLGWMKMARIEILNKYLYQPGEIIKRIYNCWSSAIYLTSIILKFYTLYIYHESLNDAGPQCMSISIGYTLLKIINPWQKKITIQ